MLAAGMQQVRLPVERPRRSVTPLTSAALLAELKPPPDTSAISEAIRIALETPPAGDAATTPPAAPAVNSPPSAIQASPTAPAASDNGRPQVPLIAAGAAQSRARRYTGWATYYGIEDGFRLGDVMYDGTAYNPADPTMTAASFQLPLHSWLLVCTAVRCIVVQVRDRGLLDENGVLLDLSRAAYAQLFAGLGGKQLVTAFIIESGIVNLFPW